MIKRIESSDNSRLRVVRKLQQKKYRDSERKFIIEGINLVSEAVSKGIHVDTLLVADGFEADDIIEKCDAAGSEVCIVNRAVYEKIADSMNGSGVIAVVDKPDYSLDYVMSIIEESDNVVVLDRLQDPGNIGTIIRTSVAAGYKAVFAVKGTADVFSLKVLRATAGMIFDMPVIYFNDSEEMLRVVKKLGKRTCVTVPIGGLPYYEIDMSQGIALVIGNEGNGISDEIIAKADELVTIPMAGDIESLNAAVSAGILMYEAIRGR